MKIGITERGDAGIDYSWVTKMCDNNIIISKRLSMKLINVLLKYRDNIIFHCTCTGYGGSIVEPNVPNTKYTYNMMMYLISLGFPTNRIVLRIDPILPTSNGLMRVEFLLNLFKDSGLQRVRYSFIDMYSHVKQRFISKGIVLPYNTFSPPLEMIENTMNVISKYRHIYEFESCAESTNDKIGCISQKDLNIFEIDEKFSISSK